MMKERLVKGSVQNSVAVNVIPACLWAGILTYKTMAMSDN